MLEKIPAPTTAPTPRKTRSRVPNLRASGVACDWASASAAATDLRWKALVDRRPRYCFTNGRTITMMTIITINKVGTSFITRKNLCDLNVGSVIKRVRHPADMP